MIFDTLKNAAQYKGLNPDIDAALEEALKYNKDSFPTEAVVVNENAKLLCARYTTHPFVEAQAEAHRKMIDVMIMIDGEETIYVKPVDRLSEITMEYDPEQDALLAKADADVTAVRMQPGTFCVLFPQDAHMPGCIAGGAMPIKKFIGKVRIHD